MKQNTDQNKTVINAKKIGQIAISLVLFFASVPALSAIPYHTAFEEYELINQETKELNLSLLANIQILIDQNRFNMGQYIPLTGLPQNDNGSVISRRILKQTFRTLSEDQTASNAPFMQTASKVNSAIGTQFESNGNTLTIRVRALETQAEVAYHGPVNATFSYDIDQKEAKFEVSKSVGVQTYAFTHIDNNDGVANQVGVRWSF